MEVDAQIISLVQRYPMLYDKNDPKYKNAIAIDSAWSEVSTTMEMSVEDTKRRWKLLRNKFTEIRKKRARGQPDSASGAYNWPLFDSLLFLDRYVASRNTYIHVPRKASVAEQPSSSFYPTKVELHGEGLADEPLDIKDVPIGGSMTPSESSSKRCRSDAEDSFDRSGYSIPDVEYQKTDEQDAELIFGKAMALQLKDIKNLKKRRCVQAQICSLISEAIEED